MRAMTFGLLLLATPLAAQTMLKPEPSDRTQPRQKLLTIYGNDPCPKSADPDEIVICTRLPDEMRFRVPEAVRNDTGPPLAPADQNRKLLLGDGTGSAGGGIGSCSAQGPGGGTGCNRVLQDQYRDARRKGEVPGRP